MEFHSENPLGFSLNLSQKLETFLTMPPNISQNSFSSSAPKAMSSDSIPGMEKLKWQQIGKEPMAQEVRDTAQNVDTALRNVKELVRANTMAHPLDYIRVTPGLA